MCENESALVVGVAQQDVRCPQRLVESRLEGVVAALAEILTSEVVLHREFAERDRADVAADRRRYRRERFAREGPDASVTVSTALWQHMRAVRPDWPTERDRAADLEACIVLKRSLDRAAHTFTPR